MKISDGIKVQGLSKLFGKIKVLTDVSFDVEPGKIVALLGPNGAGKTTTINILSTLLLPDNGTANVAGYDILKEGSKVRESIGLTGQFAAVDEFLSGRENLQLIAQLYHMKGDIKARAQDLIEQFELVEAGDRQVKTYSGGMKRRLDLAMSLISSPPVIFLDEPTTGLDPRSRLALWSMIKQLAKEGRTILLTTQYMDEAERLSEGIVVIDEGKVIARGTPSQLKSKVGAERVEVIMYKQSDVSKAASLFNKSQVTVDSDSRTISLNAGQGTQTLKYVIDKIGQAEIKVSSIALRQPTLDDVFLKLTGHEAIDSTPKETKNGK